MASRGFTLLEMLIALGVFSVIGIMSSQLVSRMMDTTERVTERGRELTELQRAFEVMRRDVEQLSYRYVRDELGDAGLPLEIGGNELIEMTRNGWVNPTSAPRTELQRVAYELRGSGLYRIFWPVLDRAPTTQPLEQLLLGGLANAEFRAVDLSGAEYLYWPLSPEYDKDPERQLVAIRLTVSSEVFGEIQRLWEVPVEARVLLEMSTETVERKVEEEVED